MDLIPYNDSLSSDGAQEIGRRLNILLANYQIYQRNLRKISWNRRLRGFLDLNDKVERIYNLSQFNINQIAERVIHYGEEPMVADAPSLLPAVVKLQALQEVRGFEEAIYAVINLSNQLLEEAKEVFLIAAEYEEETTMAMMTQLGHQMTMTIAVFTGIRLAQMN